jgi:caveolin 1
MSKSGSKTDLADHDQSNAPLIEDDGAEKAGETPEKEAIELTEKQDAGTEKEEKKKEKKAKKEKKPKKEKGPPGPNPLDTLSVGLDLAQRDAHGLNACVDLDFDDIIAEPAASHGLDPIWKLAFILFSNTKLWIYRIAAALIAVPASIVWALIFSLITVIYVWLISPVLRIVDFALAIVARVLNGVMSATLAPVCAALGALFSNVAVKNIKAEV